MPDPDPIDVNNPVGTVDPANPAANTAVTPEPMPGDPITPEEGQKTVPLKALQEERERRQSLQAELEIMKQIAGDQVLFDANGQPVARQPVQPQSTAPTQVAAEMNKLWEEDPRKAVQMEIMSAMTWRDNQDAQVDRQEVEAAQKYNDYNQYRDTVRQYVRALPIDQRAKPGVIDLAYYVVKGQASGTIYERAQADLLKKIQAGEQVQGLGLGTVSRPAPVKGIKITAEQIAAADMMGLTPEQYASQIVTKPGAK